MAGADLSRMVGGKEGLRSGGEDCEAAAAQGARGDQSARAGQGGIGSHTSAFVSGKHSCSAAASHSEVSRVRPGSATSSIFAPLDRTWLAKMMSPPKQRSPPSVMRYAFVLGGAGAGGGAGTLTSAKHTWRARGLCGRERERRRGGEGERGRGDEGERGRGEEEERGRGGEGGAGTRGERGRGEERATQRVTFASVPCGSWVVVRREDAARMCSVVRASRAVAASDADRTRKQNGGRIGGIGTPRQLCNRQSTGPSTPRCRRRSQHCTRGGAPCWA